MAPKRSSATLFKSPSKKARKSTSDDIIKQHLCADELRKVARNFKSPSVKELEDRFDQIKGKFPITRHISSELDDKKRETYKKDCLSLIRAFDFPK